MKALARYGLLALCQAVGMASLSSSQAVSVTLVLWLLLGGGHTLYLIWATGKRDTQVVTRFIHLLWVNFKAKWRNQTVGDLFLKTAERLPDKVMITLCHEEGEDKMTFREVKEMSCRVARYFLDQGYKKGEVVALVMENRVDYCCYWIGLSMIGVIPALVNSNLRQQSLLHTINVAKARAVIFSSELTSAVLELESSLASQLGQQISLLCADNTKEAVSIHSDIWAMPSTPIEEKMVNYNDSLFYIYTSGTTGLPKAAIITHSRYLFASYCLFCMGLAKQEDVLYSALPMYHTAGAAVCFGNILTEGLSLVARRKFSASHFWKDCTNHGVTCAQYIGEIARYLYATPECPEEKRHSVRMMFGNGLRPQIWQKFVDRFNIKQINEFYGSTEGNCSVGNFSNKVGAVGFVSVLFPFLLPLGLVKVDEDTREPIRDPVTGLCVPCEFGESGELVGKIERGHPVRDFQGYADKEATKKKVMKDVWRKGDLCFRSGDILMMDSLGWLYFKDRAGDTFRWKGENVSTMEVEATVSAVVGLRDCVVYGVEIPGTEGRAGMVAIPDPERKVEVSKLYEGLADKLPAYARPIFVRLVDKIDVTATYKLKKRDLQSQGFNPEMVGDGVLMLDAKQKKYLPLTQEQYNNIINGNLRF